MKVTLTINFGTHSIENIEIPGQHIFTYIPDVIKNFLKENNYDRDRITSLVITCVVSTP